MDISEETPPILVAYFGNDFNYWQKVRERYESTYPEVSFQFHLIDTKFAENPETTYIELLNLNPTILYIDIGYDFKFGKKLTKYLSQNNISKTIALVALYNQTIYQEQIGQIILAGARLHQVKSIEFHDVVYNPMAFHDENLTISPDYVKAEIEQDAKLIQDLRLAYYTDTHLTVETNSPLEVGQLITLKDYFLSKYMKSNKVLVEKVRETNLYYNSRYSIDLRLLYVETAEMEEELFKDADTKAEDGFNYEEVFKELDQEYFLKELIPCKTEITDIIMHKQRTEVINPKRVKALCFDSTLAIFSEMVKELSPLTFTLNIQSAFHGNGYQIKRLMPHVITYSVQKDDEEQDPISDLNNIIQAIESLTDYKPIIAAFNFQNIDKTNLKPYKKLLTDTNKLTLKTIKVFAASVMTKLFAVLPEKDSQRIYLSSARGENIIQFHRDIKIVQASESSIYFSSIYSIPNWTVFTIEKPNFLLTIVPIKKDSKLFGTKNLYRGLINGIGELGKQEVRSFINELIAKDEQKKEEET
jgi:hypothetical protein